jgi:hypothetical protein
MIQYCNTGLSPAMKTAHTHTHTHTHRHKHTQHGFLYICEKVIIFKNIPKLLCMHVCVCMYRQTYTETYIHNIYAVQKYFVCIDAFLSMFDISLKLTQLPRSSRNLSQLSLSLLILQFLLFPDPLYQLNNKHY